MGGKFAATTGVYHVEFEEAKAYRQNFSRTYIAQVIECARNRLVLYRTKPASNSFLCS